MEGSSSDERDDKLVTYTKETMLAKKLLALGGDLTHRYIRTHGNAAFIHHIQKLIFGGTQAHQLTLPDQPPYPYYDESGPRLISVQTL